MRIYGCLENGKSKPKLVSEITIVAEPEALRELASFFYRCADEIEDQGNSWEHEQFASSEHSGPNLVVFNPDLLDE